MIEEPQPRLFVVSTRTKESLATRVHDLRQWISGQKAIDLENLEYTLSAGRTCLEWRFAFVAKDQKDIIQSLRPEKIGRSIEKASHRFRVGFIFSGQGAQWHAMSRELILTCSQLQASLSRSESVLRDLGASWNLVDELLRDESESRLIQSWLAQPACTAIQLALVDLLHSVGVKPQLVLGHSSGEIAAACTAGFLSQRAALKVAYYRSFVSEY